MSYISAVYLGDDADGTQLYRVGQDGSYRLLEIRAWGVNASVRPPEGAPVVLSISPAKTLLRWNYAGKAGRGFDFQAYLEQHGLTYETQHKRIDVRHWVDALKKARG